MHMEKRGGNPTYDLDNAILSRTTARPKPAYELVQVRRAEPTPTFEFDLKCYRVPRANKFERLENRYPEVEKRGFNPNGYSDRFTDRFPGINISHENRNFSGIVSKISEFFQIKKKNLKTDYSTSSAL